MRDADLAQLLAKDDGARVVRDGLLKALDRALRCAVLDEEVRVEHSRLDGLVQALRLFAFVHHSTPRAERPRDAQTSLAQTRARYCGVTTPRAPDTKSYEARAAHRRNAARAFDGRRTRRARTSTYVLTRRA